MRIAIGGFQHESNSFAPRPATYSDFKKPGGFPALVEGDDLLDAMGGTSVPIAGAISAAEDATLVPLAWALANPAGPVQDEAFERVSALICARLSAALDAGPLDGVYLDLHGAGVNDTFPDLEGELLRRVRAIVGTAPVAASLDPHANLTARMVELADILVPYRTYPHIDMRKTGARAMRLLRQRIVRGKPWARAFRQLEYWIPITSQCTMLDPMRGVMDERETLADRSRVAELAFCFGFPYADFADCGAAVAAFAETEDGAIAAADAFIAYLVVNESAFRFDVATAADAVAEAIRVAGGGGTKPVVIADTQDNPGGGGHGDTTGLLAELIRQNAQGAVLGLINDAESAAACHAAGAGARVDLMLGGKSDGAPLQVAAHVLRLTDGTFTQTGPFGSGNPADLGPTALIEAAPGIRVIVVSRKMQAYDQALFRHVGIEPADCRILALKSSVHFRADFQPIAEVVLVAAAPGPVVADPAILTFRHVRPGVRKRPMSNQA